MAFSSLTQTNISFKRLSGLANTLNSKAVNEEAIGSNISLSTQTIFAESITNSPSFGYKLDGSNRGLGLYWNNGVVEKVRLPLYIMAGTNLGSSNSQGYYTTLPTSYSGISIYSSSTILYNTVGRLQVVPPAFSYNYTIDLLKADGTPIDALSPINWVFDYFNGLLFVQDPPVNFDISVNKPAFVECYIYVAKFASEFITPLNITSINRQSGSTQTLITGSTGLDFQIISSGNTHQFNIPTVGSGVTRGLLSSIDYNTFISKLSNISGITAGGDLYGFYPHPILNSITTGTTVGSSIAIPILTYDDKGRIISSTTVSVGVLNAISSLNFLTGTTQYLMTGNTTTDFRIISSGNTHVFSIPTAASGITRGLVRGADFITFSNKIAQNQLNIFSGDLYGSGTTATTLTLNTITSGQTIGSSTQIPIITYDNKGRIISSTSISISTGITLSYSSVTNALGYIPYNSMNPNNYISGNTVQSGIYNNVFVDSKGLIVSGYNIQYLTSFTQTLQNSIFSGDLYGSGTTAVTLTLNTVTSGQTIGSSTQIPVITYDNKGRIISSTTVLLFTGLTFNAIVNTLGYTPLSGNTVQSGTYNILLIDSKGLVVSGSNIQYLTSFTQTLQNNFYTGDVYGSGTTGVTLTLNSITSGQTVGLNNLFPVITYDNKGRIVSSSTQQLTSGTVITSLGYTPYNITNPNNFITTISANTSFYSITNPLNFITGTTAIGDVYGSGTTVLNLTLNNVTTGATIGSSTQIPVIKFDSKGRIVSAYSINISSTTAGHQIQYSGVTLPGRTNLNFVGYGVYAFDDLANNATVISSTTQPLTFNAIINVLGYTPYNPASNNYNYLTSVTVTGDAFGFGTSALTLTLKSITTGITVGSSTQIPVITYDDKGRIISSYTLSILTGITSINNLTLGNQFLTTGNTGLDFQIISSGNTHQFNIPTASSGVTRGLLSGQDWSTFYSRLSSISGITASGDLTGFYPNPSVIWSNGNPTYDIRYIKNSVIGQPSGVTPLNIYGKIDTQYLPDSILGSVHYKGTWNASTNVITSGDPLLNGLPIPSASTGNTGYYFIVTTSGNTTIDGVSNWHVSDWIISDGQRWTKVDNSNLVTSINGLQGNIFLTVITSSTLQWVGSQLQIPVAASNNTGLITSTDWNIFNNKQNALGYIPLSGNTVQSGTYNTLLIDSKGLVVSGTNINYLTSYTQTLQNNVYLGDLYGSGTTATTLTLNIITSGRTVGSSTQIPVITYDNKGRIISSYTQNINTGITLSYSSVTSALGYVPYNSTNPQGYTTGYTFRPGITNNNGQVSLGDINIPDGTTFNFTSTGSTNWNNTSVGESTLFTTINFSGSTQNPYYALRLVNLEKNNTTRIEMGIFGSGNGIALETYDSTNGFFQFIGQYSSIPLQTIPSVSTQIGISNPLTGKSTILGLGEFGVNLYTPEKGVIVFDDSFIDINKLLNNSILQLETDSKLFYAPRLTTVQRDLITVTVDDAGALQYNKDINNYQYFDGTIWNNLGANASNGLNKINGNIELGGALTNNILISGNSGIQLNINNVQIGGPQTTLSGKTRLEVFGDIASAGLEWTIRKSVANVSWYALCYGNGLFVSLGYNSGLAMTSPDGVNWTSSATPTIYVFSICYGNGLFVAPALSFNGNKVITSPDGITWTLRTTPASRNWYSICYGNGLFVAVSNDGVGNRVMTSPDSINWTLRTTPADNTWRSVCYGNGLFVAVSSDGVGNRVMTSPDGINWTSRTSAADNNWYSVCYGNGLFVAVATSGTGNRVMTSPDGITWSTNTSAANNPWQSVYYGNALFVAVGASGTENRVMTSPDGINWTLRTSAANNVWQSVCYGNGLFVSVGASGTGNRVMTSGKQNINITPDPNFFTSGLTVGSATQIPVITYDNKGRIISSTTVSFITGSTGSNITGITSINNITLANQFLTTGNTGLDFQIISTGNTHQFNIPTASSGVTRGLLSGTDWSTFNTKQNALGYIPLSGNTVQSGTYNTLLVDSKGLVVSGTNINYINLFDSVKEFSIVGNTTGSTWEFVHNLNNRWISVSVLQKTSPYEVANPRVFATTLSSATVTWVGVPPAVGEDYFVKISAINKS